MITRAPRLLLAVATILAAPLAARAAAPAPPSVIISSVTVPEGDTGFTEFKAQVSYNTFGTFGGTPTVEVDITAMPGTASSADFSFTPVHLTLTAGAVAQEITGQVFGDKVFEGDETFTLVAKATAGYVWSQGGVVTIADDDQTVAPKISIDAFTTVDEGNGKRTIAIPVHLAPAVPTSAVTVVFATTSGDSGAFMGTMGTLTFEPGQTTATIPVDVIGNSYWNTDRSFVITLSNPKGAVLGNAMGTVTLKNDDAPTALSMDDVQVNEGTGGKKTVQLKIHLNPPAVPGSKIWLTVTGGQAKLHEDYEGNPFQVLYPNGGETEMITSLDIIGDSTPECDEGLVLQYQAVYMGDDTARQAHLLIVDDDQTGDVHATGCIDPYYGPPPSRDPAVPPPDMTGMGGTSGSAGTSGAAGDMGAAGTSGAAGEKGAAGTGAAGTDAAGTGGVMRPSGNDQAHDGLGDRGGCALACGPDARLEGLALLGLALVVAKRRRGR
jgi:hypothetical protein